VKVRQNRAVHFRHFGVLGGSGNLLVGNHWFQGDNETAGLRVAGIVLASTNVKSAITGNYIDNSYVEWTNEYEASPAFLNQLSFGGLTLTGNAFTANDVAPWFRWMVIKPYGSGHFIQGLNVSGNVFRALNGAVDRVEGVDTSFAPLDNGRMRNVLVHGNSFTGVTQPCENPAFLQVDQATAQATWVVTPGAVLPFGGWARNVEALVAEGPITGPANERRSDMPYVDVEQGVAKNELRVNWLAASKGRIQVKVRMDNPL
jgi:hypothetical protein